MLNVLAANLTQRGNKIKILCMTEYRLSFLVEREVNGSLLDEATCETCHGKDTAFSVPNGGGDRYVSVSHSRSTDLSFWFIHTPTQEVNQGTSNLFVKYIILT